MWRMFNRKLLEFIEDLRPLLDHIPQYAMVYNSAKMISGLEPTHNQDFFNKFIAEPHEARILAKDEAFFLAGDAQLVGESNVNLLNILTAVWSRASDEDKRAIWAHLQVLLVLNRQCKAHAAAADML